MFAAFFAQPAPGQSLDCRHLSVGSCHRENLLGCKFWSPPNGSVFSVCCFFTSLPTGTCWIWTLSPSLIPVGSAWTGPGGGDGMGSLLGYRYPAGGTRVGPDLTSRQPPVAVAVLYTQSRASQEWREVRRTRTRTRSQIRIRTP